MATTRGKFISLAFGALLAGTALSPAYAAQDDGQDKDKTSDQQNAAQGVASRQGDRFILLLHGNFLLVCTHNARVVVLIN